MVLTNVLKLEPKNKHFLSAQLKMSMRRSLPMTSKYRLFAVLFGVNIFQFVLLSGSSEAQVFCDEVHWLSLRDIVVTKVRLTCRHVSSVSFPKSSNLITNKTLRATCHRSSMGLNECKNSTYERSDEMVSRTQMIHALSDVHMSEKN